MTAKFRGQGTRVVPAAAALVHSVSEATAAAVVTSLVAPRFVSLG